MTAGATPGTYPGDDSRAAGRHARRLQRRRHLIGRRRRADDDVQRRLFLRHHAGQLAPGPHAKGEPLYTGYAARIQGTVTASGFSGRDQRRLRAGRDRRSQRLPSRPTGRPSFTSTTPGQSRRSARPGRLHRRTAAARPHRIGREDIVALRHHDPSPAPAPAPVTTTIAALSEQPGGIRGSISSRLPTPRS